MKILVCISKTPDTTSKIEFVDGNTNFNTNGVQWIMNPTDEWYALVRGVELKESLGGTVTVVNVGLAENDQIIRKALAIGADDATRINIEPKDAMQVAQEIANYAKSENFDLILTGEETIDYNSSVVGSMLAALLDLPYISLASKLNVADNTATLNREIEGGFEEINCALPILVSCQKGMAEQKIPNMRGIMSARTKPLNVVEPTTTESLTQVVNYELPPVKSAVKLVDADNVDELVRLLKEEAKVL